MKKHYLFSCVIFLFQAAWGGGLLMSRKHKWKLSGVERYTHFSCSQHKVWKLNVKSKLITPNFQERLAYRWVHSVLRLRALPRAAIYVWIVCVNDKKKSKPISSDPSKLPLKQRLLTGAHGLPEESEMTFLGFWTTYQNCLKQQAVHSFLGEDL